MKTTLEWMASVDEKLSVLLKQNNRETIIKEQTPECGTLQETDAKFAKRRLAFVLFGTGGFMLVTYFLFLNFLPLFNIGFGLMLAFICITLVLLFDEYILPGDTIGKISNSPVASAIVILAFALIVVGGAQVGSGLITNRVQGEEPTPERVETSNPAGQNKTDTIQAGFEQTTTTSKNKEN